MIGFEFARSFRRVIEKLSDKGKLIIFEGGDGTGKTTQALRYVEHLNRKGDTVPLHIREPGSTPLGESVRELLIAQPENPNDEITPETEMLLYMSCRAQLFKTVIAPALEQGTTVVLERSYFSTFAYQGMGLGLDAEMILQLGQWVSSGVVPTRVILLDLPIEESLSRVGAAKDRIESREDAFHERVRQGYLDAAARFPELFRVVDARGSLEEVESRIHAELDDIC